MVRHPRESGARPRSGQAENPQDKGERVAKALARAGIASRREIERLINLGKVAVNGRILDTPAVLVKRDDILTVDGKVVNEPEPTRLWRYHKPVGLVTTHKDPQGRPTVFENLPEGLPRVVSVGRLDLNTEGLLLLTNDGELARALELPANASRRLYRARAFGSITQQQLDRLQDGITVEGIRYGSIEAKLDKAQDKGEGRANVWISLSLAEGKNREVRRVLEALGLKVNRLLRLAYGPFQLGTLEVGEVEEIGPRVIREQLAEYIAPENLPTGDRVVGAPSKPSRRPTATATGVRRGSGDPLADPNRKPSRTRAAAEKVQFGDEMKADEAPRARRSFTGDEGGERKTYKPGWAKAKPPARSDRPHAKRRPADGEGAERRPRREFSEGGEARPRRSFGEGGERGERKPRRDFSEGGERKPRSYGEGAERKPRRDFAEGGDRKPRAYGDRPERGERKPRRDFAEGGERKPRAYGEGAERKPRREFSEGGERKPRAYGEGAERKPRRDFSEGGERKPRAYGEGAERKPRRDFAEGGERKPRAYGEGAERKPRRDFAEGGERKPRAYGAGAERKPRRDFAEGGERKPRAYGEGGERKPRRDFSEGGERKPRREFGDKPERGPRREGGERSGPSRGPRPSGDRPHGKGPGRPGPKGPRKPR